MKGFGKAKGFGFSKKKKGWGSARRRAQGLSHGQLALGNKGWGKQGWAKRRHFYS